MWEDLKTDILLIDRIVSFREQQVKICDSLENFLKLLYENMDLYLLQPLSQQIGPYSQFIPNNVTLQQLKSSGALRNFENGELLNRLTEYWENLKHTDYLQKLEKNHTLSNVTPFLLKHFRATVKSMNREEFNTQKLNGSLLNYSPDLIEELYNIYQLGSWFNNVGLGPRVYNFQKEKAQTLFKLLESKFHFEELEPVKTIAVDSIQ